VTLPDSLEVTRVTKRFEDVVALDDVSLRVGSGETVALVGESGSGKTTLLRLFNRTIAPDNGNVFIGGHPADELDPVGVRRRTGFVQQEGGLLPHWTVLRNASTVPWLLGDSNPHARGRAALTRVGLAPERFGSRWPRDLSGGQRQRVALARALAAEPRVVLLDEPFGALDAITRADLQEAFGVVIAPLTVVLVTHDLHEAFRLADRVAVLRGGRIEQVATPDALMATPETEYVAHLLERSRVAGTGE
jgi:osmoprotectant transport system ATP-binding protein